MSSILSKDETGADICKHQKRNRVNTCQVGNESCRENYLIISDKEGKIDEQDYDEIESNQIDCRIRGKSLEWLTSHSEAPTLELSVYKSN